MHLLAQDFRSFAGGLEYTPVLFACLLVLFQFLGLRVGDTSQTTCNLQLARSIAAASRSCQQVSGNLSVLDSYADYACGDGSNYFLTDPAVGLNAELAELHGGCVNMLLGCTKCN